MLMHVPDSGPTVLISIPRDSAVDIPGVKGKQKINAAFNKGPALLIETIENVTGLRIDHYVEVGFGGFASVIDSVGGVNMCLPKAMKDQDAHIDLPAGCQELDGVNGARVRPVPARRRQQRLRPGRAAARDGRRGREEGQLAVDVPEPDPLLQRRYQGRRRADRRQGHEPVRLHPVRPWHAGGLRQRRQSP